jgi:hypothetical protein
MTDPGETWVQGNHFQVECGGIIYRRQHLYCAPRGPMHDVALTAQQQLDFDEGRELW